MTSLRDTKQSAIAPVRQRPTESRHFWLILGGGSIALHLVLLFGLRWMNFRATVATSTADPTSIELVELAPEAIAPANENAAPTSPTNDQPAAPPPPAPPVPELALAPPVIEPSLAPSPQASPTPSAEITPAPAPSPSPLPSPAPSPTLPESLESPTPQPTPTPLPQSTRSGESEAPNPIPSAPLSSPPPVTPGTADGSNGTRGTEAELPEIPVSAEVTPVPPARYSATVSASPIPLEAGRDIPAPNAFPQPIDTNRTFTSDPISGSTCGIVTPDLFPFLGTSVEFLVRVDRDLNDPNVGRVAEDGITTQQGSGSDEYDAIAKCLLRQWTFRPPDTDVVAENEAPSSEVVVTMQIDPG